MEEEEKRVHTSLTHSRLRCTSEQSLPYPQAHHPYTHTQQKSKQKPQNHYINTPRVIHNAQSTTNTLSPQDCKQTTSRTHTHCTINNAGHTGHSLTWLAWLCTCDPFPQHPATRLFPTVLDLPSGLEVRGKGSISFCFPSSQSTSIALAPKFIISNTQCHNHGVPHTTKLMLKLIYQALMQVYSNTVGGGWEQGWYQLAGCRAKYYW